MPLVNLLAVILWSILKLRISHKGGIASCEFGAQSKMEALVLFMKTFFLIMGIMFFYGTFAKADPLFSVGDFYESDVIRRQAGDIYYPPVMKYIRRYQIDAIEVLDSHVTAHVLVRGMNPDGSDAIMPRYNSDTEEESCSG